VIAGGWDVFRFPFSLFLGTKLTRRVDTIRTVKKADRAAAVVETLAEEYPDAQCELDFSNPWELLVATVLSAQCTDERVNQVTPGVFARWPSPASLAVASQLELEEAIRPTGFFRNKAKSLREAAQVLVADHEGVVPADIEHLVRLPGVGRKTAKVVLGEAFGVAAGVTVDTHVRRVARRLDLTRQDDPEKIADELEGFVPRDEWVEFSMRMILHGRRVCKARRPLCESCSLDQVCPKVGL
jgi:endonuclease-3